MRLRYVFSITLLCLCHQHIGAQTFTSALPPLELQQSSSALPNDPGQELLPVAVPEATPRVGAPVRWEADRQTRAGDIWTLTGKVVLYYGEYILHADKVVYHQSTTTVEAEGHLQLTGGAEDLMLNADHGEMRLNEHTGRFYQINGSLGVRTSAHTTVYTTTNPFLFSGRVLLQTGEGSYRVIDGSMTNCRLPKPDWKLLAHSIEIKNGQASADNTRFDLFGIPVFYLPYLQHPVDGDARETGVLIPVFSYSSIKGLTLGEQIYIVLGRSADLTIGSEYYSERGFSPNGDFRYRGQDLNHFNVRWNALLDRRTGPATSNMGNQGGVDILAEGRRDFTANSHFAGNAEYLSHYLYRLVFDNNYTQATDSTVRSEFAYTMNQNGFVLSANAARFQSFSGILSGDEIRILHLPGFHFDVIDQPLGSSPFYGEMSASIEHMSRAETGLYSGNDGRFDLHPSISVPFDLEGWSVVPSAAVRLTGYSNSQIPDLLDLNAGIPTLSRNALLRRDVETAIEIRPRAIEREFKINAWNRELRHVIESDIYYRWITGIGTQAQNVLLADTNDIATNTNEAGYSITQRFYLRPLSGRECSAADGAGKGCSSQPREWASWQIAQKFFFDPKFGGAVIPGNRNVIDSALDFTGTTFVTEARSSSPILSRLRFEAINNLRVEWDMDYDTHAGRLAASNVFAGYSVGRTIFGIGHSLLYAVDEQNPNGQPGQLSLATQYQQLQPYLAVGKPTDNGFSMAANGGYDLTHGALQYGGIQAVYNRGCCGITVGYRRFALGTVREEDQYLYGFTLAGFGTAGDIRRSNTVFRDPKLPPLY